jgi:hypothetical protein
MLDRDFCFLRLEDVGRRDFERLRQAITGDVVPALAAHGVRPWGLWQGLFGVRSNELFLVTCGELAADVAARTRAALPATARVVTAHAFRPTVRPLDDAACSEPGVYVFRFFEVRNRDIDEVAELSRVAWETFEKPGDAYRAVPKALFCEQDRGAEFGTMLLLTWYDGLQSWQASRRPPAAAADNFRRRAALTFGTIPFATRLVGT